MTHPKPTRLPSFLAINPRGKTPVLIDVDDSRTVMNESLAILSYLEMYYPDHGRSLLPPHQERSSRARVLALMQESENLHNAYDALEDAFFHARNTSTQTEFVTFIRPRLLESLDYELQFWERYASNSFGKFIAGTAELTLADCAFYPILGYMLRRGFTFDSKWPGLKKYYETVWDMPSQSARKAQPEGYKGKGKTDVFRGT
jgi:glutathione S-transferase